MKRNFQRIFVLLAASDLKESEIIEFISLVREIGPNAVAAYIFNARKLISSMRQAEFDLYVEHKSNAQSNFNSYDKISRLLLDEARLSKIQAIELLSKEIARGYPNIQIPSESRKGFSIWLEKLTNIISESELLHIATKIRNEYVYDRPLDWRLK